MSVFGIITLIYPAIFLVVLGASLSMLGCFWIFVGRKLGSLSAKIVTSLLVFLGSFMVFAIGINLKYGFLPISFELVRGL